MQSLMMIYVMLNCVLFDISNLSEIGTTWNIFWLLATKNIYMLSILYFFVEVDED